MSNNNHIFEFGYAAHFVLGKKSINSKIPNAIRVPCAKDKKCMFGTNIQTSISGSGMNLLQPIDY